MSENPYEPPKMESQIIGVLSGRREDLRIVAKHQKGILVCILIYLIAVVVQFALPADVRPILALGVLLVGLCCRGSVKNQAVRGC
jgi:predicted Na+-dependent transporter